MAHESVLMPKHSILLVDDNRLFVASMTTELELAGYKVSSAETVDKAELWLNHHPRPDMVVLDLQMPGRNGLELITRLNELNHIPFILLSAYSEDEMIERANRLGAMSYLVKPIDSVQLIPAIETALGRASELQSLQSSKQQMQSALDGNREINIAIGITMMRFDRDRHQAFELLRTASRQQNRKLADIAIDVISESETIIRERTSKNT
jgi:AmiR/NasT family two-component response regulator